MKHLIALLGATALTPAAALAQGAFELDEAVVYSGLIPVDVNRTGTTVEVLDDDDLASTGVGIESALSLEPGLSFSSNGGLGTTTSLRLRGLNEQYIGVTIDGIEVTDPSSTQNSLNFGSLTRAGIGRIEVAKGAQTAIYGSDAIAGAINITSWRPTRPGFSYSGALEAGSYGTVVSTLNFGLLDDTTEMAFTLSGARTDGFSARDFNEEADAFNQVSANLSFARDVSEAVTLGFSALYSDGLSEFDGFSDDIGRQFEDRTGLRAFAEIRGDRVDHEIAASVYEITREFPDSTSTNLFNGKRTKLEYLGTTTIGAATLAFGADWSEEAADLDGSGFDASNGGIFGEVQYALSDAADLSLSLRHDIYSDFDDQTSGRIALAYRLSGDTTLRASLGNGYRAPSIYERFGPFGNADLEPETSLGGEIGIETTLGDTLFSATAFYTEITDQIAFNLVTFDSYIQTEGTTIAHGVELAAETKIGAVTVFGNYTYTDGSTPPNIFAPSERLRRVPRHDLALGVSMPVTERLTGAADIRYVADTNDGNADLDDYTLANASLTYVVNDQMDAYVRVENLFNEDYQTANTYNTADRSFFVGLRADF